MSAVTATYLLMAEEGFQLSRAIAYPVGGLFAACCIGLFIISCLRKKGPGPAGI